jgi:hypothetical protein
MTAVDSPRRSTCLRVSWAPDQELEHPGWVEVGRQLGAMSRVSNWWIGDWLQYGTARWGEKYVEAAKITGYDVKTLRNIAYVAKRFESSRRRDNLTWSHHADVAVLDPQEQNRWLDRAITDRLSVADLRVELRSASRGNRPTESPDDQPSNAGTGPHATSIVCPSCGCEILPGG